MVKSKDVQHVIGLKESPDADLSNIIYFSDTWN